MGTLNYQNRDDSRREQGGFLRGLFGPSKAEIWQQLAGQIGGQFTPGGFLKGRGRVTAQTGQWIVTLDTFEDGGENPSTYTRMRAPYVNRDGFRFNLYRSSIFSPIGQMLGMQDVIIGDPQFDEAFIIKGNSETKLRQLFADPVIRQLMHVQPRIRLQVRDDEGWFGTHFPQGVDELYFCCLGLMRDVEQLHLLFELFAAVLHRLCAIGSAYENDPQVRL
jgi:hypothetical protein